MSDDTNLLPSAPPEVMPPEPPHPPPDARDENPVWSGWDVAGIFGAFFLLVLVSGAIALAVALSGPIGRSAKASDLARDPLVIIPAQFAAYILVLLFMFLVVRSHRAKFFPSVRWDFPYRRTVAFVFGGVVLAFFVQGVSALLPIPKSLPIEQFFRNATGAWLMAIFGVTMAPLVEELLFRGFLYPSLARRLGKVASVILTAAGFAFLHEAQLARAWAPLLMVFVVGLVLTLVRARTRSVAAGFLIHASYNATLFAMLYVGSDGFRHLERMG